MNFSLQNLFSFFVAILVVGWALPAGKALAWECGETHYHCESGNSIDWDENETEWTWGCEDETGLVDHCREEKPPEEEPEPAETCPSEEPVDPAEDDPTEDPIEDPMVDPADPNGPDDPVTEPDDPGMGGNDLEEDPGIVLAVSSDDDDDSDSDDDKKKKKSTVAEPVLRSLPAVGLPTFWIIVLILLFGLSWTMLWNSRTRDTSSDNE